jgi:hypothetical protein
VSPHTRRILLVLLLACTACSKAQQPPSAAAIQPAPAHATTSPGPAAAPTSGVVTGPVLETMNAASYTYVRVHGETGDVWAAAPEFPVKVGDQVRISLEMPMVNFHSTSLNRDFPMLYFVGRITPAGDASAAAAPSAAAPLTPAPGSSPHGAPRPAVATVTTPMPPPPGGITIATLFADRKALAGKPVTVHGVVVKYNAGILGLTWIHLQDGTGKAEDGSNDITVTSSQDVAVKPGDTVSAAGTVGLDKNIGSGYSYPVIVENAKITVSKTAGS